MDLLRLCESFTRQKAAAEGKIAGIQEQQGILLKELESARAVNTAKKAALAEVQAGCGEAMCELKQKQATVSECQAANERAKANISGLQQRRQQLRAELQQLREGFVASCAQLDSQTYALLQQLRARLTSSGAGIAAAVPLLAASGAAGQDGGGERDQQQQQAGGHAANDACQAQQLQHEEGCGAAVMEV